MVLIGHLFKCYLGVGPSRTGENIPAWIRGTGMEVLRTSDASSSCSRERVTAEMPVAASGKHASVLLREGRMGAQTRELPCAFPL